MPENEFALLIVRLMAINQALPATSQAPTVQAPPTPRQTVQTANKGPKETEYNAKFGVALRITSNPIFAGRTREEIAAMCLDAGCIAGAMTKGGATFENEESGYVFEGGEIESSPDNFGE